MTIRGWGRVYINERAVKSYKDMFEGNPMRELYNVLRDGEEVPHEEVRDPGLRLVDDWTYVALDDVLVALEPTTQRGNDYNLVACFEWPFPAATLSHKHGDAVVESFWEHRPEAESEDEVIQSFLESTDIPEAAYEMYGLSEPTLPGGLYRLATFPDGSRGCFIALGPDRNGRVGVNHHRASFVILKYVPLPETIPLVRVVPGVVETFSRYHGPDYSEEEVLEAFHDAQRLRGSRDEISKRYKTKLPRQPKGRDPLFYYVEGPGGGGLFITYGPHRSKRRPGSAREVLVTYWHVKKKTLRPKGGFSFEGLLAKSESEPEPEEPGDPEVVKMVQQLADDEKLVESRADSLISKWGSNVNEDVVKADYEELVANGSAHVVEDLNIDDLLK